MFGRGLASRDRETEHTMTTQKKLKQAIRSRARKTGESYTAARRQVLAARAPSTVGVPAPLAAAVPPSTSLPERAPKGAVTDAAARQKTGFGLEHWFAVLDAFGPGTRGHTDRAAHLYEVHSVPGWYAQGITVAYERARGLRQVNQSCTGSFQVNVSKTVRANVAEVVLALRDRRKRGRWLRGVDEGIAAALDQAFAAPKPREVKTKGENYAWLRFALEGTTVEIRITGKPTGASVVADNKDLPGPPAVAERRARWRRALTALGEHLAGA